MSKAKSKKCGNCQDYYVCKADLKHRDEKYLPKHKKACNEYIKAGKEE